ncbi:hypothetical protein [Lacticaseibacillus paracasei]|uniref:hypothetical protein n=1 Tax=Lacticaseibacillus paracasei TaxID=1597 RepID=UPI0005E5BE4A|nr:hypothetical protein [Lacticaseibacillus paracasei]GAN41159.1 hypothetical protein LC1981_0378 [Lacticaseibacillus paracasei NRIC 1981]
MISIEDIIAKTNRNELKWRSLAGNKLDEFQLKAKKTSDDFLHAQHYDNQNSYMARLDTTTRLILVTYVLYESNSRSFRIQLALFIIDRRTQEIKKLKVDNRKLYQLRTLITLSNE